MIQFYLVEIASPEPSNLALYHINGRLAFLRGLHDVAIVVVEGNPQETAQTFGHIVNTLEAAGILLDLRK